MSTHAPSFAALAALAALAAAGCPAEGPSYHADVAPLLNTHCVSCHQQGAIAPVSLTTYAEVAPRADVIVAMTQARLMPPTVIDASGACRDFENARWLSDDELALLAAWAEAGAPEGAPPAEAIAPAPPDALDDADVFVEMPSPYTPKPTAEHQNDDYRCFIVDPGLTEDRYLTGIEIIPGDRGEVHHMLLVSLLSEEAELDAEALDGEDADPGFECFSRVVDGDIALVAGWAPGQDVVRYPEGTGLFVAGGRKMVMQIHYNLLNGARPDLTSLRLRTAPSVEKEAALIPIMDDDMVLPAGERATTFTLSEPLIGLPEDLLVYGAFPHMHTLGRTLRFSASPIANPDDEFCLVDVPRWNFHWQQLFFYDEPVVVDGGDSIKLSCTYDTTSRTEDVAWGEGTQDEMCLVFLYLTRLQGGPLDELVD